MSMRQHGSGWARQTAALVAFVSVACWATGAAAQAPPAPAPAPAAATEEKKEEKNTGRISISGGIDFPTAYFFRGIKQETDGYIIQPYGDLTFKLWDGVPAFSNLALTIGTWNSLHGGPTGVDGPNQDPKMWYESDFYTKVGWTMFEDFSAALIYTAYMSPNDFFKTVQELAVSFAFNDSKYLGAFALNPTLLFAFEVKGQADAGAHRGVYMQLGVTPSYTFNAKGTYPITLSAPLLLGLSVSEYYEFGTGNNPTYGYFQGGLGLAVPLAFIPSSLGNWQFKAGVNFVNLGNTLKKVNDNDSFQTIGTFGIAFTY
jgi:hypothetical protein